MQVTDIKPLPSVPPAKERLIKCVVWDLDHTIWQGILLEDTAVTLQPAITRVIKTLDERGILNSIASRNDPATAVAQLEKFGLADYFVYPQIGWQAKSLSIQAIAQAINIGLDGIAFIDDQPFEREEVAYALPDVLCLDTAVISHLLDLPAFTPRVVSEDARRRRLLIQANIAREQAEAGFTGPSEAFLASLDMVFTLNRAQAGDLQRAEELTVRTNQLNTTGRTYSYEELLAFSQSENHLLLMATLDDKFGSYGRIGLTLIECASDVWTIKLLLMSCRVMSRGVGAVLISHIMRLARAAGVKLQADFIANDRNRMMFVTYRLAGFQSIQENGSSYLLQHDLAQAPQFPDYVQVVSE
jgi:FkbH-like protein